MARQDRTTLKTYFNTGDKPTEEEFQDLIDSLLSLDDDTLDAITEGTTNKAFTLTNKNRLSGVDSIADLKTFTQFNSLSLFDWIEVNSYYGDGNGGGGIFYAVPYQVKANGTASVGSGVTLTVDALDESLKTGDILEFTGGGVFTLTADADSTDTTITGDLTTANIADDEEAGLQDNGGTVIELTSGGGPFRWKRPNDFVAIISDFGALIDGSTDDTSKINAATNTGEPVLLPRGITYVNSTISDDDGTYTWQGIKGEGHRSVLSLGASSKIQISNRAQGTVFGADKWTSQGIYNLYIYGGGVAPYGVIVGTDTDLGQTSLTKSNNGMSFRDVITSNINGPAWQCGFITKIGWDNCFVKDCDYGWFFFTSENNTASDEWTLTSCTSRSNNIAGLAAYSDSVNSVSGNVSGMSLQDNEGWGGFFARISAGTDERSPRDVYHLTNVHFEGNGTFGGTTASNVTVKEHGVSLEPSHLYVQNTIVKVEGSNFFDGFVHVADDGVLVLEACNVYTTSTNFFNNCDETARISLDEVTFDLPFIFTNATIEYKGNVYINSGANDRQSITSRIPKTVTLIDGIQNYVEDPSFQNGTGGFTASSTNSPTVGVSTSQAFLGEQSLEVQYNANAGGTSDNALRFDSKLTEFNSKAYIAITFYAYSATATNLRLELFTGGAGGGGYGDNIGRPVIDIPAGKWVRFACLLKNRDAVDITNTSIIAIYPSGTDAPTVYFDGFTVTKTDDGDPSPIMPVMQGGIPKYTAASAVNNSSATLLNGSTAVLVTHNLGVDPNNADVFIQPREGLGGASEYYVDTITPTTFTIRVDSDPGKDISFSWMLFR